MLARDIKENFVNSSVYRANKYFTYDGKAYMPDDVFPSDGVPERKLQLMFNSRRLRLAAPAVVVQPAVEEIPDTTPIPPATTKVAPAASKTTTSSKGL